MPILLSLFLVHEVFMTNGKYSKMLPWLELDDYNLIKLLSIKREHLQ